MHDGDPPDLRAPGPEASDSETPDLAALAQDWITVWQSELSGAAIDREVQETWQTMAALWAGAASTMLRALPRVAHDPGATDTGAAGRRKTAVRAGPGPAAAARPAPAAAAPDARDVEIDRLTDRIADLERRLADLERRR
jgi:hypothetical protein